MIGGDGISGSAPSTVAPAGLVPNNANEDDLGSTSLEFRALYLGEDASSGLYLGLDQNARWYYDETTNDHVTLAASQEVYFDLAKTMDSASDQNLMIATAGTLGAARTNWYGVHIGQSTVTLAGNTLDNAYNLYVGAAPASGTAKYSLGVAGAAIFAAAVTLSSTLAITGAITASGGVVLNDDSTLANTKNLALYATAAEYITLDGDGMVGMAMATDVAAPDIQFTGFSANASATSNKDGGDLIFQPGTNETGGTGADGNILLKDADGNTEFTVATTGCTVANSLTLSSGATFGGAELIVGASNVLHLGASGGTPTSATASGDVYAKQVFEAEGGVRSVSYKPLGNATVQFTNHYGNMGMTLTTATVSLFTTGAADASSYYMRIYGGVSSTTTNEGAPIGIYGGYNSTDGGLYAPVIIGSPVDTNTTKYAVAFTAQTEPTFAVFGAVDPDIRTTQHAIAKYNQLSLGDYGSRFGMKFMEEEVTIAVGEGNTPIVVSSTNLAPAGSAIFAVAFRVTQAPGGGATTLSIGITGGVATEFVQTASCDILGENALSILGSAGDGTITTLKANAGSATTFDLTTDADVTGTDMKVRVTVAYFDFTIPAA